MDVDRPAGGAAVAILDANGLCTCARSCAAAPASGRVHVAATPLPRTRHHGVRPDSSLFGQRHPPFAGSGSAGCGRRGRSLGPAWTAMRSGHCGRDGLRTRCPSLLSRQSVVSLHTAISNGAWRAERSRQRMAAIRRVDPAEDVRARRDCLVRLSDRSPALGPAVDRRRIVTVCVPTGAARPDAQGAALYRVLAGLPLAQCGVAGPRSGLDAPRRRRPHHGKMGIGDGHRCTRILDTDHCAIQVPAAAKCRDRPRRRAVAGTELPGRIARADR